jgi:hypothetical protein
VLDRIFRADPARYGSLKEFFEAARGGEKADMKVHALAFLSALFMELGEAEAGGPAAELAKSSRSGAKAALAAASSATAGFGAADEASAWTFPAFLDACMSALNGMLRDSEASVSTIRLAEKFAALSRDALMRYTSFNANPVALAERLLQAMLDPNP